MGFIKNILGSVRSAGSKSIFAVRQASPELCTGLGITCFTTAVVVGCVQSTKLEKVVSENENKLKELGDKFDNACEYGDESYSEDQFKKDIKKQKVSNVLSIVRLYSPVAITTLAGALFTVGGHKILSKRNVALASAYELLDQTFKKYRERVVEDQGEEADKKYRYGLTEEKVKKITVSEDGEETVEESIVYSDGEPSLYSKWFDSSSHKWENNNDYNALTVHEIETDMTNRLRAEGHLSLNTVYRELGLKETKIGQQAGWHTKKKGKMHSDDFVRINIIKIQEDPMRGVPCALLLDFNCCGNIFVALED